MNADEKAAELAAVVAERGALPMPVAPEPADAGPVVLPLALHEAQLDALVAAGNRVVNDEMHEHLCMCDTWPKGCVSTGAYFMGAWDVDGLEAALPAVLGLWERMRGSELTTLRARVAELEAESADAVAVSEALNRALCDEKLTGSALYAALTQPTTSEQRQAALDRFLAVAHRSGQVHGPVESDALTQTFVPVASLREPEGEFYPFLHKGRVPHDLPETGGTQC